MKGTILNIDEDGDAQIKFDALKTNAGDHSWVFSTNFNNLKRIKSSRANHRGGDMNSAYEAHMAPRNLDSIRRNWRKSDTIEVFSESAQKWFTGYIHAITHDQEGE